MRKAADWWTLLSSLLELLEAPSDPAELEAVTKAKVLYRSCMNESECVTWAPPHVGVTLPSAGRNPTPHRFPRSSHTGEVGLQADVEDPETARVPLAGCGRWPWGGVPVVGGPVEPSEDAGRHEEPPQQERPGPPVRVPRR